ncbi:MFS transporter [Tardiphaga sp. vice352]|uniref:MFS transporter n=1 Tax=unclassified Tardiphaga TaxID=2631404 RepID=UPI001165B3BC|nr:MULTISPECIES: MFS transporter [unclassified Tardiphaga]QDM20589.1 MFS transporter [Tardiphaga sp. vice154]QDM25717.1 MFS transporter [Tardiphaga sp. vice304]QDM30932.1 MFS transporter [Tardiphaga sp. vice352]
MSETKNRSWLDIPRGIWALGFVSMFMDISSEMIHALFPLYLVTVLGASMVTVGFIEGIAEATAMITKVFSGAISDWLGRRKLLVVIGYGLAAFTKPVFPLASSIGWFVGARLVDRIGKGIRGAPRDALIADIAPEHIRGASFGLRQSLDTVGAFVGPLLVIGLMLLTMNNFKLVFWIAVIPAFIAFALLVYGVEEPKKSTTVKDTKPRMQLSDVKRLTAPFWVVVGIAAIFTLGRFSEAFLILKAQNVGMPIAIVPAIMVVMNVVYAVVSYPAGVLSDRIGRNGIIFVGIAMLVVADLILAFGTTVPVVLVGVVFWGLHMGLTQGLLATLVADTAPPDLRGTAFGMFNLASGVAMLAASVIAGGLWDVYGPRMTFFAGAAFTAIALVGLLIVWSRKTVVAT